MMGHTVSDLIYRLLMSGAHLKYSKKFSSNVFYASPIPFGHSSQYCDISCCYLCFVCVCHTVLSVPCSLVNTCWEKADLLALFYMMFYCVFVTFTTWLRCDI